ncbi:MAG: hypothetical protein LBL46_00635 [Rickettsiales bacterium]|jgi:hypothetical protein|nr:hypothetical protein [Rickettsiales bacterium]
MKKDNNLVDFANDFYKKNGIPTSSQLDPTKWVDPFRFGGGFKYANHSEPKGTYYA